VVLVVLVVAAGSTTPTTVLGTTTTFRFEPPGMLWMGELTMRRACCRGILRAIVALLTVVFLLLFCGCTRCSEDDALPAPKASVEPRAKPAEPVGLAFLVKVPRPAETWSTTRKLLGQFGAILPSTVELALGRLSGLPLLAHGALDGQAPAGALGLEKDGAISLLWGVHVRSPGELLAQLTTGAGAGYVSEKVGPIVHLKGKAGEQLSLALLDSYLLVAAERWAIDRAAGFFTEELRAEQRKSEGVFAEASRAALFGPLSKIVKSMWQAQRRELDVSLNATRAAQGRPPDFAEPTPHVRGTAHGSVPGV
jgi:hypothetical protein